MKRGVSISSNLRLWGKENRIIRIIQVPKAKKLLRPKGCTGKTSMPLQRPIPSDMEIAKPTVAQLIQLSLEEKKMTQKQLAMEIGVSPSRISDYISGRAKPTLKIARQLCAKLGIAPAAMLGCKKIQ